MALRSNIRYCLTLPVRQVPSQKHCTENTVDFESRLQSNSHSMVDEPLHEPEERSPHFAGTALDG